MDIENVQCLFLSLNESLVVETVPTNTGVPIQSVEKYRVGTGNHYTNVIEYRSGESSIRIGGLPKSLVSQYTEANGKTGASFALFVLTRLENEPKLHENVLSDKLKELTREFIFEVLTDEKKRNTELDSYQLFRCLNQIAATSYEKSPPHGSVVFVDETTLAQNVSFTLRLTSPVKLSDTKLVRKLLETTNTRIHVISDGHFVLGTGEFIKLSDLSERLIPLVEFLGRNHYKLSRLAISLNRSRLTAEAAESVRYDAVSKYLLSVVNEQTLLNDAGYDEARLHRTLAWIFGFDDGSEQVKKITSIVEVSARQKKGTMLVFSEQAKSEIDELEQYGIKIEPTNLDSSSFAHITSIDGAVILDTDGKCYGVGLILDGIAKGARGRKDRGARYNSAVKYVAKCETRDIKTVVVVVSEDGMVDILPDRNEFDREINLLHVQVDDEYSKENYPKVVELTTEIMKRSSPSMTSTSYFQRAYSLDEAGNLDEALETYQRVLDLEPDSYGTHFNVGSIHWRKKNYEKALEHFQTVVDLGAGYSDEALQNRAKILIEIKKPDEALSNLSQAIEKKADGVQLHYERGQLLFTLGRYEDSIFDFNSCLKLDPGMKAALFQRARCYSKLKSYKRAITDYTHYIRLDKEDHAAYTNRGFVRTSLGDYLQASKDFTKAIRIFPEHALSYLGRAKSREMLSLSEEAMADYSRAVEIDPSLKTHSIFQASKLVGKT